MVIDEELEADMIDLTVSLVRWGSERSSSSHSWSVFTAFYDGQSVQSPVLSITEPSKEGSRDDSGVRVARKQGSI